MFDKYFEIISQILVILALNLGRLKRHLIHFFHNLIIVPTLIRTHAIKLENKTLLMPRYLANKLRGP